MLLYMARVQLFLSTDMMSNVFKYQLLKQTDCEPINSRLDAGSRHFPMMMMMSVVFSSVYFVFCSHATG